MSKQRARQYLAKYLAFSNASAFIGSHGDEGHAFVDEELNDKYLKETKRVSEALEKKARVWLKKYEHIGIDIDSESED